MFSSVSPYMGNCGELDDCCVDTLFDSHMVAERGSTDPRGLGDLGGLMRGSKMGGSASDSTTEEDDEEKGQDDSLEVGANYGVKGVEFSTLNSKRVHGPDLTLQVFVNKLDNIELMIS